MDGAREGVGAAGLAADGQKLAFCHGLAVCVRVGESRRVEVARSEEVGLDPGRVAGGEVAVYVARETGSRGVDEVTAEAEEGNERAVLGETGKTDAVGDAGVHGGQSVGVL